MVLKRTESICLDFEQDVPSVWSSKVVASFTIHVCKRTNENLALKSTLSCLGSFFQGCLPSSTGSATNCQSVPLVTGKITQSCFPNKWYTGILQTAHLYSNTCHICLVPVGLCGRVGAASEIHATKITSHARILSKKSLASAENCHDSWAAALLQKQRIDK